MYIDTYLYRYIYLYRAVLGMSLRKVTYKAFLFSVFSRNQE